MEATRPEHSSHLFMVRLWNEDLGSTGTEWRAKVQHVASGNTHYLRDWTLLLNLLLSMLTQEEGHEGADEFSGA